MRPDLHRVVDRAAEYLESLSHCHVSGTGAPEQLLSALDRPLPEEGLSAHTVIDDLSRDVEAGLVARWIVELLGLPGESSVGFVTGCQMADFAALSVARNTLLERSGWNLDERGLFGAPPIRVFMNDCGHTIIWSAARMMGIGWSQICTIPSDSEGCLELADLKPAIQ